MLTALILSSDEKLQSITPYDKKSRALYQIILSRYQSFDGYVIPSRIDIRKNRTTGLRIESVQYWPNAVITPGIFILSDETEAPLP